MPIVKRWRLDILCAQIDVSLTAAVDLVVDRIEQEIVDPTRILTERAVMVSKNRSRGIRGQKSLIVVVLSYQRRKTSLLGGASGAVGGLHSAVSMPRSI